MKICILTHTFPRHEKDYAAPFMHGVAQGMAEAGSTVFVLTPFVPNISLKRDGQKYKIVTYKYIYPDSFHKLGYSQTLENDMGIRPVMLILSPFMYLAGIVALWRLVKKEKIDLINAHWILPNGFIASVVSLVTGVPVVSTLPGSDVYMAQKNWLFRKMAQFSTYISTAITSNSPQLLSDLVKIYSSDKVVQDKIKKKQSAIIYGVDPKKFYPTEKQVSQIKSELSIDKKKLVVLGVGRLVEKKGFRYLIEASKTILKENKHVVFVLIGEGDQRKELEQLASKLGVLPHFIFPGWVDYEKLLYYYNTADIFILPSVRDNQGNLDDQSVSVVEAMACGKPIITSDFSGYKLVIENGENGFLVAEKDSFALADSLKKLIDNPQLRDRMGKASRDRSVKMYSWRAIGAQYNKLFNSLLVEPYSQSVPKIFAKESRIRKGEQIRVVLDSYLHNTKGLSLLDVGCSNGIITNLLSKGFKRTIGIDVDAEALSHAVNEYESKKLSFKNMSAEKMSFPDSSFDVVIANQVYEFVDSPQRVVSEIHRVLKKGGICFFGARNKYALIEAQYNIPFLSWVPKPFANFVVRISGKGRNFVGNYKNYSELIELVKKFTVHDYTQKILKNPSDYGYKSLNKYKSIARILPLKTLTPVLPNYIWILEKK